MWKGRSYLPTQSETRLPTPYTCTRSSASTIGSASTAPACRFSILPTVPSIVAVQVHYSYYGYTRRNLGQSQSQDHNQNQHQGSRPHEI